MTPHDQLRVGVVQMRSTADVVSNLELMADLAINAVSAGCELVAFPENCTQLAEPAERVTAAESLTGMQMSFIRKLARQLSVHVLVGSLSERSDDATRTWNTSVLVSSDGSMNAVYRKIHLFDVDVCDDTRLNESASTLAGHAGDFGVGEVEGWKLGMSICYDLRFPELYRELVSRGADILTVPAAFTFRTGAVHWEVLLRARAIENQCYVLAPAQTGRHYGQRESWGHAMVVSPWGEVVAMADGSKEDVVVCDLKREYLRDIRQRLPALTHRRIAR